MSKHAWIWLIVGGVLLYLFSQKVQVGGQEGHAPVHSDNLWTIGGGWYSQHFPFGAQ